MPALPFARTLGCLLVCPASFDSAFRLPILCSFVLLGTAVHGMPGAQGLETAKRNSRVSTAQCCRPLIACSFAHFTFRLPSKQGEGWSKHHWLQPSC